jgi:hypothetical protein
LIIWFYGHLDVVLGTDSLAMKTCTGWIHKIGVLIRFSAAVAHNIIIVMQQMLYRIIDSQNGGGSKHTTAKMKLPC